MKNLILILSLLLISQTTLALDNNHSTGPYVGLGVAYDQLSLTPVNQTESNFEGWSAAGEGGFNVGLTDGFGLNLAAEYRLIDANNTVQSASYMERATFNQYALKAGFFWGSLTFGAGYVKTDVDVKNVSSGATGQTTHFTGTPKMAYANYGFEKGSLRAALEGQYEQGNLTQNVKFRDISVGIRFYFLFDR